MTSVSGRHAVITGAGRGIGAAIAERLSAEVDSLTLLGRNSGLLEDAARKLRHKVEVTAISCDITRPEAVTQAFQEAKDKYGPVSILINNAGQAESMPFHKTSLDVWQRMLDVNLTGTFLCTQAVMADMLAAGSGRIVNVASTAGLRGYGYVAAYVAAKHGVIGLTRSLALEVAKRGITVNAVCPGYTDTDIVRESIDRVVGMTGRSATEATAEFVKSNPQGRLVRPEEVADTVAWLCSQGAGAITGQSISVSGGEVM